MIKRTYTYNMYTLAELSAKHNAINEQIDQYENELEQTLAGRYYTIRRESIYNTLDEIEDIKKDLEMLAKVEESIRDVLWHLYRIRDRICMAQLRHPDFKL